MDEQRALEQRYAMLVKRRGELKGLSHKKELAETKEEIEVSKSITAKFEIASGKRPEELDPQAVPAAVG